MLSTKSLPLLAKIWAVILSVVLISLSYAYVSSVDTFELRNHLARWTVLSLELSVLIFLVSFLCAFKDIKNIFLQISKYSRLTFVILIILGSILVAFVTPRTNRIFFDEHIYENIAQGIAFTGKAFMCNEGEAEYGEYKPFVNEYNKQPNGHPFFISLFFKIFGAHEWVAHLANNVGFIIAAIAVFGIVLLAFNSEKAALFAMAFYIMTPMAVIWSNTVSAEPSAAAFSTLAIFSTFFFLKKKSTASLFLMVASLTFAIQFRPELILLPIPVFLIIVINNPSELTKTKNYWAVLLFLIIAMPEFFHLFAVRGEGWGSSGKKFGIDILFKNIKVNGPFYFRNIRYPLIFSIFAIFGLLKTECWKKKFPLFIWFLMSWGIFLLFYAGSYNYGADVRFSLMSAPPIAIFAGLGAWYLIKFASSFINQRLLTFSFIIIIFMLWSKFLPLIRAESFEAADARFDVKFARELADLVPPDSIVLTHNPNMWLLWGKNAAQASVATSNRVHLENDFFNRYHGGVYYHHNFWCNVPDPGQNRFGEAIRKNYKLELIKEYNARRFRYALYRVHLKSNSKEKKQND